MSGQTAASIVAEARTRVENLTPVEVLAALDGETLLVDVRQEHERVQDGFIPGDLFAPRGMLEFWADPASVHHRPEFRPERRVVLYCASGGRSVLAADTLRRMGYRRVAHLDGGLQAWKEEGRAVDRRNSGPLDSELHSVRSRESGSRAGPVEAGRQSGRAGARYERRENDD